MSRGNRIWIELDKVPANVDATEESVRAFKQQQCDLANKMLAKLVAENPYNDRFFLDHKGMYCYGGNAGYKQLADRGEWFNLDYLAQ